MDNTSVMFSEITDVSFPEYWLKRSLSSTRQHKTTRVYESIREVVHGKFELYLLHYHPFISSLLGNDIKVIRG